MSKNVESGFYASRQNLDVFAYDEETHSAVWLRIGNLDLIQAHPELEWELPHNAEELREFLIKYGFAKLPELKAMFAIVDYVNKVKEMIAPTENMDLVRDPLGAIKFVTTIQTMTKSLGKSIVEL